jgi:hypothetical protein
VNFEDLSIFDLDLIKSIAVGIFVQSNKSRYEILTEVVLNCIKTKGFKLNSDSPKLQSLISECINPKTIFGSVKPDNTANEVIFSVFNYLKLNNISIEKDETLTATWPVPNKSWYTPYDDNKKPWIY